MHEMCTISILLPIFSSFFICSSYIAKFRVFQAKDIVDVNSDTAITNHPVHFIFQNVESGYEVSKCCAKIIPLTICFTTNSIHLLHHNSFQRGTESLLSATSKNC